MSAQESQAFTQLKQQLREMFQLERGDLDFGIYRIMNQKRKDVIDFLDNQLLPQVQETLKKYRPAELDAKVKELKEAEANPGKFAPDYIEGLRKEINSKVDIDKLEKEIYSDLYNFFKRYYSDGDFMSMRRYKEGVYALPYEGEEVKLHWANHDQYYIKTSEDLKNYTFKTKDGKRVRFEVVAGGTETNNNKAAEGKERRFALHEAEPVKAEGKELFIRFEYVPDEGKRKQDAINKDILEQLFNLAEIEVFGLKEKAPTEKDKNRTLLEKHLTEYTAKHQFDYFIHKDLGKFLRQELDFYIKNEIMHLDDIENEDAPKVESYLGKVKAMRKVAGKIIQFLAQLEDFQKKLWLKKKFVLETHYCVTLDKIIASDIADDLLPEIAGNNDQREEWVKLFAIDDLDGYSETLSVEFLKANDKLLVDTKFFDVDFKYKLVSIFHDIDDETDGLLINSENFQALNLLQQRYKEKVKCIYIDPPYNTGNDGFAYKDLYKHSSWLSMMDARTKLAHLFCKDDGCMFVSINDNETMNLEKLLKQNWGEESYQTRVSVKVRHEDRILRADIPYQEVMEDLHLVSKNSFKPGRREYQDNDPYAEYLYEVVAEEPSEIISLAGYEVHLFKPSSFQINKAANGKPSLLKRYTIRGSLITQKGSASEFYELNLRSRRSADGEGCLYKVIGMGTRGDGIGYRYIMQPEKGGGDNGIYFQGLPKTVSDSTKPYPNFFDMEKDFNNCSDEGGVSFSNGRKPLSLLEKVHKISRTEADSSSITLDFFAGSGTTGHSVIALNQFDGGNRKYILIEMGDYFSQVTKPRILNAVYSRAWKNGKPIGREGASQVTKYVSLEQYEDTLDNLGLTRDQTQAALLDSNSDLKEQYMLGYMLDVESKGSQSLLNVDAFDDPFSYNLRITRDDDTQIVKVDLIETFNYLLGLHIKTIDRDKNGIVTVTGKNSLGEKCLIIWRNVNEIDNDKLDEWFGKRYSSKDFEFDAIYINGDNNIENMKFEEQTWKVRLIEKEFKHLMFDVQDV